MFCKNCGSEIVDGAKFCAKCGTVVEVLEEAVVKENQRPKPVNMKPVKTPKTSHMSNSITLAIVAVCALLGIGLVAVLGVTVIGPMFGKGTKQMVYLQDEELYYLKDMSKPDKAIEVDKIRDMDYLVGAKFSEDGKYLYYYSECEDDGYQLNRIKVSKLKSNGKHDKYIEEIASDVAEYTVTDNNIVYYIDDKECLIQYKNGEETKLEKNISDYEFSDDEETIYYSSYEDSEYELGSINTTNGKTVQIDDGIQSFSSFCKKGYFVYSKKAKGDEIDIYMSKNGNKPVCVAEDAYSVLGVDTDAGVVYYQNRKEEEKPLCDFVNDTLAEADAEIKMPDIKDAMDKVEEEDAFDACMTDSMKEEYLTGKDKDLKKYYEQLFYDEEQEMYYDYAVESDDVYYYYYDDTEKQWYILDNDKYDEVFKEYDDAYWRNYLREDLKEETYSFTTTTYSVYSVSEGKKAKEICSDVYDISVNVKNKLVTYSKMEIDIQDIKYTEDVIDYIESYNPFDKGYYKIGDGAEQKLELDGGAFVTDSKKKGVVILAQPKGEDYTLYYAEISGDKIATPQKITDDAYSSMTAWVNGELYYERDFDEDDSTVTLCRYSNGKSETIVKDVTPYVSVTTDSYVIGLDEDLTIYDMSGKGTKIAKEVTDYSYLSRNQIVYMSEGDLYFYGKSDEKLQIAKDVKGYCIYIEQKGEDESEHEVYSY